MKTMFALNKISLGLTISVLSVTIHAQSVRLEWAKSMGGSSDDRGYAIARDASGNIYTVGEFEGTADFDPDSTASFNLTSNGYEDIFIQKLDASGNFIWAKSVGGTWDEGCRSISLDGSGNIYLSGSFAGTVDFDPGVATYNLTPNVTDAYILKLDANGNFIWAKAIGVGNNNGSSHSMTTDISGNVYVTGSFWGTLDFDPGVATYNLTSLGQEDIFIEKLDANGNFIWAKAIGGISEQLGLSITTDASGNSYTTGYFGGSTDFDPDTGTSFNLTSSGGVDIFIEKLDANGDFVWAKSIGGTSGCVGYSITNASGNVYVTGHFSGTADFNPGVGTSYLTSNGAVDIFIQKLSSNGNFIWAKSIGGTSLDEGRAIAIDDSGNVFVTGYYSGTMDTDPGGGTLNVTSNGSSDVFIEKLDASGDFVWAKSMGGAAYDIGHSIITGDSGIIYTTGYYGGTMDFDPSVVTFNLTSVGGEDAFVQKFSVCEPDSTVDVIIGCDSITWIDGITYGDSNNTATFTLSNINGCDSVVTLELTIISESTSVDVITTCDSITWIDGITYTSRNNTATFTFTNAAGCDSIVTLDLTFNTNTGVDVVSACYTYTWIDGITYTTNNNSATFTLTNANGCDSVVTLDLTLRIVDVNVIKVAPNLTANAIGASYQWLDCNNNYAVINGETSRTFTASKNGSYAVEVTQNGCTDTSECITLSGVGIRGNRIYNDISIFPNPTSGKLSVDLDKEYPKVTFDLTNIQGQLIHTWSFENINQVELDIQQPKGIHLLHVKAGEEQSVHKIVKE